MALPTNRYFNLGLPQLPHTLDPKIEPDLRDVYNALRNLTIGVGQRLGLEIPASEYQLTSQAQYTIGDSKRRLYVVASEAITYGQIVSLWNDAGVLKVRLANATNSTRPGYGICNTAGTCAIGDILEIVLPGAYVNSIGGLTLGTIYWLSTTSGAVQTTPPAVAGNIVQAIGFAIAADKFFFDLSYQFFAV